MTPCWVSYIYRPQYGEYDPNICLMQTTYHSTGRAIDALVAIMDKSRRGGKLRLIKTKMGDKYFLGCTRYPDCKYSISAYYTSENY